ncbi:hypothetical protein U9M48_018043, partial [Paspalum notatum var. saurae]
RTSSGNPFSPEPLVLLQDLPGVRHDLLHGIHGHEPLRPRRQARELGGVQKVGAYHLVHRLEPDQVAPERDVHEPHGVAAEERLPLEHSPNARSSVSTAGTAFSNASALCSAIIDLNSALNSRPEPRRGAVVGVGREEARSGRRPGVVDVLQYHQRLAHRAAAVDEDGDLLVHRVGVEQELALAAEGLLDVLVAQPLEPQRHSHPDHPRARPRAQQPQLRRRRRHPRSYYPASCRCHCR